MDFRQFCNGFGAMTCVISVEDLGDGRYGKIRIVDGNDAYISSIENPAPGVEMLVKKFIPNSEYTNYLTRDLNFEDYSYRAAVERKCLHSYVKPDRMPGVLFNMTFLPVAYEEGNLKYCTYTMEINFEADSKRLSNISTDIATAVLETSLKLRIGKDFKSSMAEVIKDIRELCDAEHCCILLLDHFERKCSVLCESFSDNTDLIPMENYLDDKFYDITETWKDVIAGSNCVIAKNDQDMDVVKERSPIWYESLSAARVKRIVLFPLKFGEELLGYIWAINFDPEKAPKIKETLETTTFILGSEINSYLLMDRLKILSSKDMLTGVMNRNEMNNLIDKIYAEDTNITSVGVIFTDLNGLKTVNDQQGHTAGDNLLKNAARALEEVFNTKNIFRAGGDEFTVILTNINEEKIRQDVEDLSVVSERYGVCFSIGSSFTEDNRNIKDALRIADERMYEDKKHYYELHPDKIR
ncbi:diguanylate cyclase (GGDEF) domain-containing protein [Eubacterium uniforme]|uniref:Diguanylate cyclase (GGDEF) domain-containing protein n=1 Tax=Eubacterium uniforme TaxID=39495 RepID=A0A1T4VU43_9FIRM|nr:GGDEF domain-containing protein [Eubacterium uniforme]SKA68483.1 diguanylate cyclase (GGDEF) domain-containing protein [Eubacterium uniforme]